MDAHQSTDSSHQPEQQFTSWEVAQSNGGRQNSYLDTNQQDLLLAALNSQANGRQNTHPQIDGGGAQRGSFTESQQVQSAATMNGAAAAEDNGVFISPTEAELHNFGDYTPELDYLEDGFDFENADLGGEMIGSLPGGGDSNEDLTGQHEKRKIPDGKDDGGDAKRQETGEGEKGAKKPGRKPLTSEPTTKRKAQNRAAQRAFRERKEAHLKDLETKVSELTKTQEADKHENGLLKAQIERLHIELREYRKRLSLNSGSARGSPPLAASGTRSNSNPNYPSGGNFQFDFPKFGALPGSQIFGNSFSNGSNSSSGNRTSATPPLVQSPTGSLSGPSQNVSSRENSMQAHSMSPRSINGSNHNSPGQMPNLNPTFAPYSTNTNMHGFESTLPQMNNPTNDPFGDLFSPSILKGTAMQSAGTYFGSGNNVQMNGGANNLNGVSDLNGGESTAGLNRVFQFNGGSTSSDTASPSASSASQWNANANSSCGTSPEPSHDSPAQKLSKADTFCDKIDPRKNSTDVTVNQMNMGQLRNGDYSVPSLDSFDPVLFGDYRDSNDAIVGGGDFTGGFFDEALNPVPFDYASPTNLFGILQSPQQTSASLQAPSTGAVNAPSPSKNLMADMDKIRDGGDDDYGLPSAQAQQTKNAETGGSNRLISCNSIWNQLQSNPDFQDGKFDLDGLCSELRAKARCSESGVMVDQDHVDAALRKLGKKDDAGNPFTGSHQLMFEQESWDKVLAKMHHRV